MSLQFPLEPPPPPNSGPFRLWVEKLHQFLLRFYQNTFIDLGTGLSLDSDNKLQVKPSDISHGDLSGITGDAHSDLIYDAPAASTRNVVQPGAADVIALVLKNHGSQSVNLFEAHAADGGQMVTISNAGVMTARGFNAGSQQITGVAEADAGQAHAVARTQLESTSNGKGASIIGVEDGGSRWSGANIETVLAEVDDESLKIDGTHTMTGALKLADGSASSPSLSFGSDADTGIYRIGADDIGMALGGAEIIRLQSASGATPLARVMGSGDAELRIDASQDPTNNSDSILSFHERTVARGKIYWDGSANDFVWSSTAGDISIMPAVGVGINNLTPDASSQLDIVSTTKGFLPPRMTTTQMNAISSPATGLVIYNTTENRIYHYDGSAWLKLESISNVWEKWIAWHGNTVGDSGTGTLGGKNASVADSSDYDGHTVMYNFTNSAKRGMSFSFVVPGDLDTSSAVTAKSYYRLSGAPSEGASATYWGIDCRAVADNEVTASGGAASSITNTLDLATASHASGDLVVQNLGTLFSADTLAAGDYVKGVVWRDGGNGADTYTGTCQHIGLRLVGTKAKG